LRLPEDSEIISALNEACRRDFATFVEMWFVQFMPSTSLPLNWHLEAISFRLEQVRRGKIKRLMINAPPRYWKSFLTSVFLPAYLLGLDPTKRIIVVSYGSELAVKLANEFRALVNSAWYKNVFPDMEISRMKNTEYEVVTTRGGYRLATSIDGALTGRGCDILIIDDPLKPSDAYSDSKRKRVNDQFRSNLFPRLDDKKNGAIIIVMQRLYVDDLCGSLLSESDDWTRLSLSAVAEKDEPIEIGEGRYYERREGEPLDAKRESKEDWDAVQSQVGSDIWAAQFQQRPIPPEGAMIKRDLVRTYEQLPIRNASSFVCQSWDTAVRSGGKHDYSVCLTLLVHDDNYYIIDVFRDRIDYLPLRERAKSLAQKYKPNRILIEESGNGPALVADLKDAGLAAVAIRPEGNKLTRLSVQLAKLEGGRLFRPREAPWLADFEAEIFAFPNAPHDDQVDALSQALAHAGGRSSLFNDKALENYGRLIGALSFPR
jgi:predicted phage terminase large subunit-like protein